MKPVLQLYALCLTELDDYKESHDYWDKIDDELKLKPLYQDPIKRKRRLDNLKLVKVQELLFDEYINKLKEPKEPKKPRASSKKEVKKEELKTETKKEVKTETKKEVKTETKKEVKKEEAPAATSIMTGEIRIINSKVKESITYSIKIMLGGKIIYSEENKEGIKSITKDKILDDLLIKLYKKFKKENAEFKLDIKINYKDYIKKFNILLNIFNDYSIKAKEYDRLTNDIGLIKTHKELSDNAYILEIKDNINLILE